MLIPKKTSPKKNRGLPRNAKRPPKMPSRKPSGMKTGPRAVNFIATSCAVIVVPIPAPRMTPRLCTKDIRPESTRPRAITVTAVLDWVNAVTTHPRRTARGVLFVAFLRNARKFSPATFCISLLNCSMP